MNKNVRKAVIKLSPSQKCKAQHQIKTKASSFPFEST